VPDLYQLLPNDDDIARNRALEQYATMNKLSTIITLALAAHPEISAHHQGAYEREVKCTLAEQRRSVRGAVTGGPPSIQTAFNLEDGEIWTVDGGVNYHGDRFSLARLQDAIDRAWDHEIVVRKEPAIRPRRRLHGMVVISVDARIPRKSNEL
jgi:hypothetical protein